MTTKSGKITDIIPAEGDRCEVWDPHLNLIERIRGDQGSPLWVIKMASLFKVLSQPVRLNILTALIREELCVCDLAMLTRQSVSNVSHHLNTLRQFNLVKARRQGKMVFYTLADDHISTLISVSLDHIKEER